MKISIKTLKNKKYDLEVSPDDTVLAIKERCQGELDLGEVDTQKLIHSGKILRNEQTLASAGVKDGDFMVIMVTAPAAAAAKPKPTTAPSAPAAAPAPAAAAAAAPAASAAAPVAAAASASGAGAAPPAAAASVSVVSTAASAPAAAGQGASDLALGAKYEETVQNLIQMGFPRDKVVAALRASFNNAERAVEYLFNGIPAHLQGAGPQPHPAAGGAPAIVPPPVPAGMSDELENPDMGDEEDDGDLEVDADGNPIGGGGGDGDGGAALEQLHAILQQNPQILPIILNQIAAQNPQLANNPAAIGAILQNPLVARQLLQALLAGGVGGGGGAGAGGAGGAGGGAGAGGAGGGAIELTPEERRSIEKLESLGFPRRKVIEAFFICDRNEEFAANYLFEHMNDGND